MFSAGDKVTKEELQAEIEKLRAELKAPKNDNIIWSGKFEKELRITRGDYAFTDQNTETFSIKGPGVVRELKGSEYLVIALADSDSVTLIDKHNIYQLNLDAGSNVAEVVDG